MPIKASIFKAVVGLAPVALMCLIAIMCRDNTDKGVLSIGETQDLVGKVCQTILI